jgi:sulfur relay (sulfurtransferase) complex TusBCD TusD component (DsrE family)
MVVANQSAAPVDALRVLNERLVETQAALLKLQACFRAGPSRGSPTRPKVKQALAKYMLLLFFCMQALEPIKLFLLRSVVVVANRTVASRARKLRR